ncbi:MAG: HsdR family type I site-specific deoxyribonuclease [Bifidobacterium tibiigranuli]|jgi:type I restriction enzyme R subunit|uniref:type I restriction endonuclease subunit R n=1 Tax=Bifidobacterium tibiigranuli TaxID=2172043 RepID=UPI0026EF1489|nr:HsdR family type I site-specific deoxyribonuclease [Bifidobacterium tibiigranuli]MCI1673633.1 HsdR family type I site-specific deoxyribonuclease [Bifidobacterium tibiigranuli]MCI1713772.1 HsdR family type I site-specific deoxyribonuclease [Bifidobacterium tibiigranuli]MCI1834578.1 HsdR family type I site-specific deoxyribonuclease [Bifidobacterium tibiigranuli]
MTVDQNDHSENRFEEDLIQYLCRNGLSKAQILGSTPGQAHKTSNYLSTTKFWNYEPHIKTTEQLWANFKAILERHNQNTLDHPLSAVEFAQVRNTISNLSTPYQAGQFLYGLNGVSQIEVDLDDGRHAFLTVFDQKQIGAGDTIYQVVNQIERPAVIAGMKDRRFDTTLLINGLPIIQIEEKRDTHDVNEALNQMGQYIAEGQYHDIFSTLQILVAMTPNDAKYMANTTAEQFNKDFAFRWQDENSNEPVRQWRQFSDAMLSIPMAHQMATNFMILDGTPNRQMIKVMRPYQVYATQQVLNKLKYTDFETATNKIGYIWHTTGSGKTITSFKTAWLASRLPNVDKVVFVVDRIALTNQTLSKYQAYDPDAGEDTLGSVMDTRNTSELNRRLKAKGGGIIITSVQKLDTLVQRASFKAPDKHIVFVVDEAHRSTGGKSFRRIQQAFKHATWVGYTGTPMFDETTSGARTEDIFGPLLHAYTIREAITGHNVLGFKVDFETTIDEDSMETQLLPEFYRNHHPSWTEEQIQEKSRNPTPDDMDDAVEPSVYDNNDEHVRLVVEDIYEKWQYRSSQKRYNAILTTHVGGGAASTPMALKYFDEFHRVNEEHRKHGGLVLKVAVTFSYNATNNNNMKESNSGLFGAVQAYNKEFGTSFDMTSITEYTQDVTARLDRTISDKQYLDLVIVIDQLLTGFDAPQLNTLYVDRTLKGASLIQAYSRTNRIEDMQNKPWGRVVNYRWPSYAEKLMNQALAIYANKDSANLSQQEQQASLENGGVLAKSFPALAEEVSGTVEKLRDVTDDFHKIPNSKQLQDNMAGLLRQYNAGVEQLKQYPPEKVDGKSVGFDYQSPDELATALGFKPEEEKTLTVALANELREAIARRRSVPIQQIDFRMTHIKDVEVDYDYLTELIEQLLNEVHEGRHEDAADTQEKIKQFANGLEDRQYANQIVNAADAIARGDYPTDSSDVSYPVKFKSSDDAQKTIRHANTVTLLRQLQDFRIKWGIVDVISSAEMRELFSRHHYDMQDLDDTGQIREIVAQGSNDYRSLAHDEGVQHLSKIKYRSGLREAIYALADDLAQTGTVSE